MHDARAISNYFIARSIETRWPISALSLLKVLYFAHAWHLVKYSKPLVKQPFEAWKHGPVNRVVYDQIKGLNKNNISDSLVVLDPSTGEFCPARANINAELEKFLANIFDYYARFDGLKLSDLTHEPGSPWHIIWQKSATDVVLGMRIPDALIKEWFSTVRPIGRQGLQH